MTYTYSEEAVPENIAATLARVLPKPEVILSQKDDAVIFVSLPPGHTLREIDTESLEAHPRRAKGIAAMDDAESFLAYVNEHARIGTTVWCNFNPQTFALSFTAVLDEHAPGFPGWRGHLASFIPKMSAEWKTWTGSNARPFDQLEFAEFLEANEQDIAAVDGMPSSLQMKGLATEFVARQDLSIKSVVRIQNGGVQLNYVNDADAGTTEAMRVFEKFSIGIPVFWTAPDVGEVQKPIVAYRLDARLKYKLGSGKVKFHFELIRPDRVHQKAAVELIETIRLGLVSAGQGPIPLHLGTYKD